MKKKIFMIITVLMLCLLAGGCSVEVQNDPNTQSVYYLYDISADETQLEKVDYNPEETTAEYMLKDMMQQMNQKEDDVERISLLPDDVQMNYSVEGEVLVVNFNSQYTQMSKAREILVRAGVVKTFLQVPGISAVRFTVENQDLTDSKGESVGEMTADTFAEFSGNEPDAYCSTTFTLYFTDKSGEHLVAEQRNVYYKRILPRERVILEQLAKGPMVKGHYPTIPQNTDILGVEVSDNICYVNFSSAFSDSGVDIPVNTMIYSVVNSLLDTSSADKVQISIEGNTEAALSDGTSLYNLFNKNTDLILKEDQD